MHRAFLTGFAASAVLAFFCGIAFLPSDSAGKNDRSPGAGSVRAARSPTIEPTGPNLVPAKESVEVADRPEPHSRPATIPSRLSVAEWTDQEIARLVESEHRAYAELDYYPLLQELSLPSDTRDRLLALVVRRRLLAADLISMWQAKKIQSQDELHELHANLAKANDEAARNLLGPLYPRYESYSAALPVRRFAEEFAQYFPRGTLSPSEAASLIEALVGSYAKSPAVAVHDRYALPIFPNKVAPLFQSRLDAENKALASLAGKGDLASKVYQPLFDRYVADLKLEMAQQRPVR